MKGVIELRLFQHDRHWSGAVRGKRIRLSSAIAAEMSWNLSAATSIAEILFISMRAHRLPRTRLYVTISDNGIWLLKVNGSTS
jgi:hypothetical protein